MLRGPPAVMICTISKLAKATISVPQTLPGIGAVDLGCLVELLRDRLEGGEIHDEEEGSAVPDVDQDDGEARPIRIAQPGNFVPAKAPDEPVEGAVCRVKQSRL